MSLLHDKRLKSVQWKDLTRLSFKETFIENTLNIPWLLFSLLFAWKHWYIASLPCSFIFFLTGLRQVHNGFHYTLGTSKPLTELTIIINSILMMTAMHAVKYNHILHHKYCLQEGDVEGRCAKMTALQALLYGPVYIYRQHSHALHCGSKTTRTYIIAELLLAVAFGITVFTLHIGFLQYHIITMGTGECFTAFFAVWTVHHGCDEEVFARTLSNRWKNKFTYNMFYHLEHHLFPKVPTTKLPELSKRLKDGMPGLVAKEVF
ncbi:MAG TPA: fatty acid desaturase [Chitinophagaceae bacterium]|nr:fatty acid desaturase [Chitinophagaceae bacterium]